jgi:hypothetical protein
MAVDINLRPRPILDAASSISKVLPALAGIVTALVMVGLITSTQANAITVAFGAIATVVATVAPLVSAFRVVSIAEPQVTPLSSPMTAEGTPLVPATPVPYGSTQAPIQRAPISPLTPDQAPPYTPGTPETGGGPGPSA